MAERFGNPERIGNTPVLRNRDGSCAVKGCGRLADSMRMTAPTGAWIIRYCTEHKEQAWRLFEGDHAHKRRKRRRRR